MFTQSRRERQWRERHALIIAEAENLFAGGGYRGLNLDHLAERVEYSKATLYNHFSSKEDLLLAVANAHLDLRYQLFSRALSFPGVSRERMCVVGVADELLCEAKPYAFSLAQLVRTQSIWEHAGEDNRDAYERRAGEVLSVVKEIVRQARQAGDLPSTAPSDEQIMTGIVSLAKGSFLLGEAGIFPGDSIRPGEFRFANYNVFLDGAGWRPLSTEYDYEAARGRARSLLSNALQR